MDRLSQRIEVARRALGTLEEVLAGGLDDAIRRDAAIQRFECSFEAVVKTVQAFLIEREGTRAASPKAAARVSFRIDLLSEEECAHAISMVDDRNLTVHTYNESLAIALSRRLEDHAILLRKWLDRTAEALDAQPTRGQARRRGHLVRGGSPIMAIGCVKPDDGKGQAHRVHRQNW